MSFRTNSIEKKWILYDVANSAFTLLVSTIMPIYFNYLASQASVSEVNYLAFWGYATSAATMITAILAPILGTASDFDGKRRKFFLASLLVGAIGCVFLGFTTSWICFLFLFVLAKSAYSLSLVFYDSMLVDVTTKERMDTVSAKGYAWGYIGSCIPFLISLLLVLFYGKLGISMHTAMSLAFLLIAIWWISLSVPLLKSYRQPYLIKKDCHFISASFGQLFHIFQELKSQKRIVYFLLAFFFYIDGVYTIIDMATAYGTALGLDTTGLLLALLVTQIVAFPAALFFGKLCQKYKTGSLIRLCIVAYFLIALYGITLKEQYQFWILAVCVGIFQGAIQSMSRSYFAKIIPEDRSGEYFGIYDICGKGASFAGTTLVSLISQITGQMNIGVGSLAILFFIGFLFFLKTERKGL